MMAWSKTQASRKQEIADLMIGFIQRQGPMKRSLLNRLVGTHMWEHRRSSSRTRDHVQLAAADAVTNAVKAGALVKALHNNAIIISLPTTQPHV